MLPSSNEGINQHTAPVRITFDRQKTVVLDIRFGRETANGKKTYCSLLIFCSGSELP
jgi:hypothetical protein